MEFLRFFRTKNPVFILIYFLELFVCFCSNKVIFVSETDAKMAQKFLFINPEKILVIHNRFYEQKNVKAMNVEREFNLNVHNHKKVLFFGALDYKPNIEAVNIILNKIAPFFLNQHIVFLIAGRNNKQYSNTKNVFFLSFVPNIYRLIDSCELVIVPLVSGSGTRLKILESIGMHTRTISTEIGAEGIDKEVCGDNLIITKNNDWKNFIEKIEFFANKEKQETPRHFFQKYEWHNIFCTY